MTISVIVCDKIVFDKATLDLLVMAVSPLLHDVIVIVFDKSNSWSIGDDGIPIVACYSCGWVCTIRSTCWWFFELLLAIYLPVYFHLPAVFSTCFRFFFFLLRVNFFVPLSFQHVSDLFLLVLRCCYMYGWEFLGGMGMNPSNVSLYPGKSGTCTVPGYCRCIKVWTYR